RLPQQWIDDVHVWVPLVVPYRVLGVHTSTFVVSRPFRHALTFRACKHACRLSRSPIPSRKKDFRFLRASAPISWAVHRSRFRKRTFVSCAQARPKDGSVCGWLSSRTLVVHGPYLVGRVVLLLEAVVLLAVVLGPERRTVEVD